MNNFQLNNTSVYLGGQCKWDIVIGNYNGLLYVEGFQLTPLSDNVPFNKRGTINYLNKNHSYTLKKFYNSLKENFWSIEPCLNQKVVTKEDEEICGVMDNSFYAGTRRSSCYPVYNKQYECLQPLWLEKIEDDDVLKFNFNLYSISSSNKKILDFKSLSFSHIDVDDERFKFHNEFIVYFKDWLKQLNIIGDGNNKTLNVDLQNSIAQVDGVSVISGQKSNTISCDYVCNNLLSYERPNVETDYILTTLFKTHNLITSQLFNFCFCFNIDDVVNPFFINQLNGKFVSIGCDAILNGKTIERRSLFTNYEFIGKDIYNPFMFINKMKSNNYGGLDSEYEIEYVYNSEDKEQKYNVLDYLRDYENVSIKNINKISQHIVHWDFVNHLQDVFNLYYGYSGLSTFNKEWSWKDGNTIEIELFDLIRLNGNAIVSVDTPLNKNSGALNWINPAKILLISGDVGGINTELINKIQLSSTSPNCIIYKEGKWTLDESNFDNNLIKDAEDKEIINNLWLTFIYIDSTNYDMSSLKNIFNSGWIELIQTPANLDVKIFQNINTPTGGKKHYVIFSKNINTFTIKNLTNLKVNDENFSNCMKILFKLVKTVDNELNFYGFKKELEIGNDELNNECYYESPNKKTFVYRKCGVLSPCMKTDNDFSLNYEYYQSSIGSNIIRFDIDSDKKYSKEYRSIDDSVILSVIGRLSCSFTKKTSDETTVENLIKTELGRIYNTNVDSVIDYIYKLYNITYKFEYTNDDSLDEITYNVSMILK